VRVPRLLLFARAFLPLHASYHDRRPLKPVILHNRPISWIRLETTNGNIEVSFGANLPFFTLFTLVFHTKSYTKFEFKHKNLTSVLSFVYKSKHIDKNLRLMHWQLMLLQLLLRSFFYLFLCVCVCVWSSLSADWAFTGFACQSCLWSPFAPFVVSDFLLLNDYRLLYVPCSRICGCCCEEFSRKRGQS